MKKCLIFAALALTVISVYAVDKGVECSGENGPLAVQSVGVYQLGTYNYKDFYLNAPETSSYYVNFWLRPVQNKSGKCEEIKILVNGAIVASMEPEHSNWQVISVPSGEIELQQGLNTVSVGMPGPFIPDVEIIKISKTIQDVEISSEAYGEFLDMLEVGSFGNTMNDDMCQRQPSVAGMAHFTNVPLMYTYYGTFFFNTLREEVTITSESSTDHYIDVMYYGRYPEYGPTPHNSIDAATIGFSQTVKLVPQYIHASSEEMQGLNWRGIAEYSSQVSRKVASVHFWVPKIGIYLVRLRTTRNGQSGIADLDVNGQIFQNCPMTYSGVNCVIPADTLEYASMTVCNHPAQDDALIFIHGADGDRIVGYNDDAPSSAVTQYQLGVRDAFVSQKYLFPTTGISVSNYHSNDPVSTCNILARAYVPDDDAAEVVRRLRKSDDLAIGVHNVAEWDAVLPSSVKLWDKVRITAPCELASLTVYDLSGRRLAHKPLSGTNADALVSDLNIFRRGIYVMKVATASGEKSFKVAVL